jgi:hypothetical protein
MKTVNHYKKDGTKYTGGSHKMSDGTLHSGKVHSNKSIKLYHYAELSKKAKDKARLSWR